jgi:hypothetical protein
MNQPKAISLTELDENEGRSLLKKNSYLFSYDPTKKFDINSTVEQEYNPIPDHLISILIVFVINKYTNCLCYFINKYTNCLSYFINKYTTCLCY